MSFIISRSSMEIMAKMATTAHPDRYLQIKDQAEVDRLAVEDSNFDYEILKKFSSFLLVEKIPRCTIG